MALISPGVSIREVDVATYIPIADLYKFNGWRLFLDNAHQYFTIYLEFTPTEVRVNCQELMQEKFPGPYYLDWSHDGILVPVFNEPVNETLWLLTYS